MEKICLTRREIQPTSGLLFRGENGPKKQNKEVTANECRIKVYSQCFRGKTDSRPRGAAWSAHLVNGTSRPHELERELGFKQLSPTRWQLEGLLRSAFFLCKYCRRYRTGPGRTSPRGEGAVKVCRVIVSNHVTDRRTLQGCLVPEQGIQGSRNVVPAYYATFYVSR